MNDPLRLYPIQLPLERRLCYSVLADAQLDEVTPAEAALVALDNSDSLLRPRIIHAMNAALLDQVDAEEKGPARLDTKTIGIEYPMLEGRVPAASTHTAHARYVADVLFEVAGERTTVSYTGFFVLQVATLGAWAYVNRRTPKSWRSLKPS